MSFMTGQQKISGASNLPLIFFYYIPNYIALIFIYVYIFQNMSKE